MNNEELKKLFDEINTFCQSHDLREYPQKYFSFRRSLYVAAKETTCEKTQSQAIVLAAQLKGIFNSQIGATPLRVKVKDGHSSLTAQCRLASQFEFKPQPLVHGTKHYLR